MDKNKALEIISNNGTEICRLQNDYNSGDLSDELKNNKKIVHAAIKYKSNAFEYASNELKDDKEIVLPVIKNYTF